MNIDIGALNAFKTTFANPARNQADEDMRTQMTDGNVSFSDYVSDKTSRWLNRTFSRTPSAVNRSLKSVSGQFYRSVQAIFNGQEIPQSVKDALGVHDSEDGKMRPLSVRCIRRVERAIQALVDAGRPAAEGAREPAPAPARPAVVQAPRTEAEPPADRERQVDRARQDFQLRLLRSLNVPQDLVDGFVNGTLDPQKNEVGAFLEGAVRKMAKAKVSQAIETAKGAAEGNPDLADFLADKNGVFDSSCHEAALGVTNLFDQPDNLFMDRGNFFDTIEATPEMFDSVDVAAYLEKVTSEQADEILRVADELAHPEKNSIYRGACGRIDDEVDSLLPSQGFGGLFDEGYDFSQEELRELREHLKESARAELNKHLKLFVVDRTESEDVDEDVHVNWVDKAVSLVRKEIDDRLEAVRRPKILAMIREQAMNELRSVADGSLLQGLDVEGTAAQRGFKLRREDLPALVKNVPALSPESVNARIEAYAERTRLVESKIGFMQQEIDAFVKTGRYQKKPLFGPEHLTGLSLEIKDYVASSLSPKIVVADGPAKGRVARDVYSENITAIVRARGEEIDRPGELNTAMWKLVYEFADIDVLRGAFNPTDSLAWMSDDSMSLNKDDVAGIALRNQVASLVRKHYQDTGSLPDARQIKEAFDATCRRLQNKVIVAFDTLYARFAVEKNRPHRAFKNTSYFGEQDVKVLAAFSSRLRHAVKDIYAKVLPKLTTDYADDAALEKEVLSAIDEVVGSPDMAEHRPHADDKLAAIKNVYRPFDPALFK